MAWVDMALLCVLGLSMIIGVWRGLISQILSLLGWGVAYFTAYRFAPAWATHIPLGQAGSALNLGVAFVLLFLLALLLWGMLTWVAERMMHASPLSGADRLLGGVFGLARGVVMAMVAVTVVGLTPLAQAPAWQRSQGVASLQEVLGRVRPLMPQQWMTFFPADGRGVQLER